MAALTTSVTVVRWIGRVLSLLSVAVIILFLQGEGRNLMNIKPEELLLFLCFPVGVSAGNLLGWYSEKWGGALGVASLGAFLLVHAISTGALPDPWAFVVLALPSFAFVIAAVLRACRRPQPTVMCA